MFTRFLIFILSTIFLSTIICNGRTIISFYNVENLFDTIKEPGKLDGDFTPNGKYKWDTDKYTAKINNIAYVISEIKADIIGLAEVENSSVLEDLISTEYLGEYDYVHFESNDRRGIDVALLYNVKNVSVMDAEPLEYKRGRNLRNILYVKCKINSHFTDILVCHTPSVGTNNTLRKNAVNSVKYYADSLYICDTISNIIIMGNLNANPNNKLLSIFYSNFPLGTTYINPYKKLYNYGFGTYKYNGRWNVYDQIILNKNTANHLVDAHIFVRDYLITPSGRYEGYPLRFQPVIDGKYGYSDHLPVYLILDL